MKKILLSQTSCLLAQSQDKKPQKVLKRVMFINNGFIYPVFFEIDGGGGPFTIDPNERDPDEMSEEEFRRRYLGR